MSDPGSVGAPMAGEIIEVKAAPGSFVKAGQVRRCCLLGALGVLCCAPWQLLAAGGQCPNAPGGAPCGTPIR